MKPRQALKRHAATFAVRDLFANLLRDLETKRKSPYTIQHLRGTVLPFIQWLESDDEPIVSVVEVERSIIKGYLEHLHEEEELAPRTVHGIFSDIRRFLNYCVEEEALGANPMLRSDVPPRPTEVLDPFTTEEIIAMLVATRWQHTAETRARARRVEMRTGNTVLWEEVLARRDHALVCLLVDTGIRLRECAELRFGDIDLDGRVVKVRSETSKGGFDRTQHFDATAAKALSKYMKLIQGDDNTPLWQTSRGPLTRSGLIQVLIRIGEHSGVDSCSAHKFRRSCAITMLRRGAKELMVKATMGHRSIQVLQRYVKFIEEDKRKAHELHCALAEFTKPSSAINRRGRRSDGPAIVQTSGAPQVRL